MPKIYTITISKQLAEQYGLEKTIFHETGENPPDAIKNALEKEGYKVRTSRLHSYSRDKNPADIMTSLEIETKNSPSKYTMEAYYRIRIMIKI